ncbi:hypothetical protein A0H81_02014 [Grifola frondosa]|uniref:Uncharacterized protein n=1 Tax=Grifola frondosa TaxID=5627 RepID=A0A1C7MLQ3_GRIFR|nr:hypothetical protein A0H81_02014 [Grifola frondosa]
MCCLRGFPWSFRCEVVLSIGRQALCDISERVLHPNATPPSSQSPFQYADGRWAWHDWTIHPQRYDPARPHRPFVYEQDGTDIDSAFVTMEDTVSFRTHNYQNHRGHPSPLFLESLLGMYRSSVELACLAELSASSSIIRDTSEIRDALSDFEICDSTLEKHRKRVALIQQYILDYRSFAWHGFLCQSFNNGLIPRALQLQSCRGCWLDFADSAMAKFLVFLGIPCWIIVNSMPPLQSGSEVKLQELDSRFSIDPFDEKEHHPNLPAKANRRRRRKEQRQRRKGARRSSSEDEDSGWEVEPQYQFADWTRPWAVVVAERQVAEARVAQETVERE